MNLLPQSLRRVSRLALLAVLLTVAPLGTTPATAAEYTINACQADRTNYATTAFEDFATRGMVSPNGGVGKSTTAFVLANVLASHLKLHAIAVDASRSGTLGRFPAPSARPAASSSADLLDRADGIGTAAELRPYVTQLPTGLHLLAASQSSTLTPGGEPGHCGRLVALLSCFYETVVLDLGPGVTGPLARLALDRADQVLLVTTPDQLTATIAIHALDQLDRERATVVVNRSHPRLWPELRAIEECIERRDVRRPIAVPDDRRLSTMLQSGTYSLEALDRVTRLAVKRLGLAVAERLV